MFYGRNYYINLLEELLKKPLSSVVTCRGRRRVGKSTLFEEFARRNGCRFLKLEGRAPGDGVGDREQREAFGLQLAEQSPLPRLTPEDWPQAFKLLDSVLFERPEWTVLLLDKISWMGGSSKTFASDLKIAWDNHLKKHDRLIMVICGSVSSWVTENFVESTGFVGRRSYDFILPELPLEEAVGFWKDVRERRTSREILDVLSVTGGVPRYLEEIDPSLSADDNIRRLGFLRKAVLREDFDEMFTDVITRQTRLSGAVLRSLVHGSKTVSEIASAIGVSRGGDLSGALSQLMESGLVSGQAGKNPKTGEDLRIVRYRIRDNYARFYLRYLEPVKDMIDADSYQFSGLEQFSGWETDLGFQFENLVLNNFRQILKPLHLENVLVKSAAPYAKKGSRKTGEKGVQIDLLVQTNMALCLVEIKRKSRIGREVIEDMKEKCARLPRPKDMAVRTALVYEGELDRSVEADGYFDAIIPFRVLLGL